MGIWLLSMFAYLHAGFFGLFAVLGIFNGTSGSILIKQVLISAVGIGIVLVCRKIM